MNYHLRPRRITQAFIPLALKYALRLAAGLACLLWLGVPSLRAADRYVVPPGTPGGTNAGNYTNWSIAATQIQWAVARAVSGGGETVWVTNGTYYLTNQIAIANITLSSVNGREVTTINGNYPAYSNRCLYLNGGQAVVTGLTIMNGYNTNTDYGNGGGGVKIDAGTLRNCHITTNTCNGSAHGGGGIMLYGAAARVYDCIISSNFTTKGGGGACGLAADFVVSNCVFLGNVAAYRGGGFFTYSAGLVVNCTFRNNYAGPSAGNAGGGIYNSSAACIYRNCLLVGNQSENVNGGGGFNLNDSGLVQNSTIVGNIGLGAYTYLGGNVPSVVKIV